MTDPFLGFVPSSAVAKSAIVAAFGVRLWSQKKTASKMTIARIPFRFPFLPPRLPHDSSEWRSCLPYNLADVAWNLRLRKGLINQFTVNVASVSEKCQPNTFPLPPYLSA